MPVQHAEPGRPEPVTLWQWFKSLFKKKEEEPRIVKIHIIDDDSVKVEIFNPNNGKTHYNIVARRPSANWEELSDRRM